MKFILNKKIISFYFIFISISVVVFLFQKNNIPGDFSISEYLINYSGGMTRRGLIGTVSILLSNFTSVSIRLVILTFQIIFHLLFLFFLFKLLIRNKKNTSFVDFFCIFSPLFLIYPLAELESLGRKEILIFISFLYLVYNDSRNLKIISILYSFFILPFIVLTWELVVLFFPFYLFVFCLKKKCKTLKEFLLIVAIFIPSIFTFIFIWINPLSIEGHKIMCKNLQFLDNGCWGGSSMLVTATIYFDTFEWIHDKANFFNYLNYFIYFVIGFFPIFFTLSKAKNKFSDIFLLNKLNNIFLIFFLIYIPIPLIFIFALDWGRWINIVFTLTYILFIFLREKKFIKLQLFNNFQINKVIFFILFFLFCLSWHPRILLWEKTGTFPIYRVATKVLKFFVKGNISNNYYLLNKKII
jgi:hypothetical protein